MADNQANNGAVGSSPRARGRIPTISTDTTAADWGSSRHGRSAASLSDDTGERDLPPITPQDGTAVVIGVGDWVQSPASTQIIQALVPAPRHGDHAGSSDRRPEQSYIGVDRYEADSRNPKRSASDSADTRAAQRPRTQTSHPDISREKYFACRNVGRTNRGTQSATTGMRTQASGSAESASAKVAHGDNSDGNNEDGTGVEDSISDEDNDVSNDREDSSTPTA